MPALKPQTRKWTRAEYYRMADLGLFDGQRVELIEGTVVQMPPQKNFHVIGIDLVHQALSSAFGSSYWVRLQAPLHLGPRSAPEPDAAVVPGGSRDYAATGHPTTALLIVEVSDTTLPYDRGRKASLYTHAGIADYWILNLVQQQLEVYRRPVPDPTQHYRHGYADVLVLTPQDHVALLAAPKKRIAVAELLP
jgi:Uma2 family endonuclease